MTLNIKFTPDGAMSTISPSLGRSSYYLSTPQSKLTKLRYTDEKQYMCQSNSFNHKNVQTFVKFYRKDSERYREKRHKTEGNVSCTQDSNFFNFVSKWKQFLEKYHSKQKYKSKKKQVNIKLIEEILQKNIQSQIPNQKTTSKRLMTKQNKSPMDIDHQISQKSNKQALPHLKEIIKIDVKDIKKKRQLKEKFRLFKSANLQTATKSMRLQTVSTRPKRFLPQEEIHPWIINEEQFANDQIF